jgi:hypothetical protein
MKLGGAARRIIQIHASSVVLLLIVLLSLSYMMTAGPLIAAAAIWVIAGPASIWATYAPYYIHSTSSVKDTSSRKRTSSRFCLAALTVFFEFGIAGALAVSVKGAVA